MYATVNGSSYSEGGYYKERNLPYQAETCAAFGLPKDESLKSITIYPAEILGVAAKVGSIEPGKDATLIVTTAQCNHKTRNF